MTLIIILYTLIITINNTYQLHTLITKFKNVVEILILYGIIQQNR